jgi:hypothetical protein
MHCIRGLCGVAVLLLVAGTLSAQEVKTDHDAEFDFATIKTYAIGIGTSWNNQISEKRVMASLDSVLQAKGWTKSEDTTQADAAAVIHGGVGKKQELSTYYSATPYARFRWAPATATVSTHVYEYPYGALVVDIFDLKSKALVFRGTAEGELSDKQEENQKKLVKTWKKMFKDFPPQPQGK